MEGLSEKLSTLNMALKRSYVDAFFVHRSFKLGYMKKSTRLELARAKNKKENIYNKLMKSKERSSQQISKMRELEAEYEATKADVRRLKESLKGDESD